MVYNISFRLNVTDFKKIVDMAYEGYIPRVHICGTGEPFMNKDILSMMDYVIKIYGKVSLQTNFYKPLFDRYNYLDEILKRKDRISYITTDILSGDKNVHNKIKKGSSYDELLNSIQYISDRSNISFQIGVILTKYNFCDLNSLICEISNRKIKGYIDIFNLYSYGFNQFTDHNAVYKSTDVDITNTLSECKKNAKKLGVKLNIPEPTDKSNVCDIFWRKVQTWPVQGIDPGRKHENLIPHACNAVVNGGLNSLGYIFDYDTVMDFWNNDIIVKMRNTILEGKRPFPECADCYAGRSLL